MPSVFTRIVKGDIPSYKVAENDRFFAFLDINPMKPGHTLVIPKREVDYIFDLEAEEVGALFCFAQCTAKAIQQVVPCKRIGIAVLGMEVPHAHIHLVPLDQESDIDFRKPKYKMTPEEFAQMAEAIADAFNE